MCDHYLITTLHLQPTDLCNSSLNLDLVSDSSPCFWGLVTSMMRIWTCSLRAWTWT